MQEEKALTRALPQKERGAAGHGSLTENGTGQHMTTTAAPSPRSALSQLIAQ
jgi:hypothetical protein